MSIVSSRIYSISEFGVIAPILFSSVTEFPALSFTNKYVVIFPYTKLDTSD